MKFGVLFCQSSELCLVVFWILVVGRVLGGIATSALFSAFESWLVGEAAKRGVAQTSLDAIFSNMYFANGLMAILMGMLA